MPFPMNMPGAGGIGPEVLMQIMEMLRRKRDGGRLPNQGLDTSADDAQRYGQPPDPQSMTRPGEMPTMGGGSFGGASPGIEDEDAGNMMREGEMPTIGNGGLRGADPSSVAMPQELMQLMQRLGIGGG
jgi:hypothetical protein